MGADDNRRMTTQKPLDGTVALTHWGVIRAHGADAANFLHGQLTNDFVLLGQDQARLAGYCSAKGRLLASFIGWKRGDDEVLLACSADLLAPTLKRLSMFVLRAKCKLSDASAEVRLFGLAGASAIGLLGHAAELAPWGKTELGDATVVRLPDAQGAPRFLWAANASMAAPPIQALSIDAWRMAEVQSGVPTIEAATADQFVPQMLNFELLGGVDFKKGCYPGQEIVARSQYRGTIKRRTFLFHVDADARAGQELFHSADPGQPAGLIANAAPSATGSVALAVVKLAALHGGSLHLGSADGPVLRQDVLPYDVPLDVAA
jgi:folate-binding protein YgfZ